MTANRDLKDFASLIEALHPWLNRIVVIGGWAYRLYRLHPLAQQSEGRRRRSRLKLAEVRQMPGFAPNTLELSTPHCGKFIFAKSSWKRASERIESNLGSCRIQYRQLRFR